MEKVKKVLEKIWKFVNSKVFGYILVLAFATLFLGMCNRNTNLKDERNRMANNITAMTDTITTVKTKYGEIQSSISGYVATIDELKVLNSDLAEEVEKQEGKVISLNKMVFTITQERDELAKWKNDHPPVPPDPPTPIDDSTWNVPWVARYEYDSINVNFDEYAGESQIRLRGPVTLSEVSVLHLNTDLTYRNSSVGVVWGQEWEGRGKNKQLKVFARTAHPSFETKLMKGYYADLSELQRDKWWQRFGVGPELTMGWDFMNNQPALVFGVGVHWNIITFF